MKVTKQRLENVYLTADVVTDVTGQEMTDSYVSAAQFDSATKILNMDLAGGRSSVSVSLSSLSGETYKADGATIQLCAGNTFAVKNGVFVKDLLGAGVDMSRMTLADALSSLAGFVGAKAVFG